MPEYDFFHTVRTDLDSLSKELDAPEVSGQLDRIAQHLGASREVTLAVLWRSSKRHGETLSVFLGELANQLQRETARSSGPAASAAAAGSTTAPKL